MEYKNTTVNIPVNLWQRLKYLALERDTTMRKLLSEILVDGIDRLDHEDGGN